MANSEEKVRGRVLLVDDDEAVLSAIKMFLEQEKYQVVAVDGGRAAQQLISMEKFDVVLTDIRMPDVNGIALLHFIKRNHPVPVILMTGFAELSETKEAYELGADEFVPKPFKRADLITAIGNCIKNQGQVVDAGEKVTEDEKYCKLSIDDFVSGKEIQCDIFIRLSESKYVMIAHQGEDIERERIQKYKQKNIKFLYMRKADFRTYVGFNLSLAKVIKTVNQIPKEKKLNFLKNTGELIMENLFANELKGDTFDNGRMVVETTLDLISEDDDLFKLLSILNTHADFLYAHSLGVSLYGAMIARELKWTSPVTLFKISVGGLLHDIGKKEIDRTILMKQRQELSLEERKLFESHPIRGMEILSTVRSISSDILQIVQQHHENCVGLGYPAGLKKNKIHPIARLISVANEFCNLALRGPHGNGIKAGEAIKQLCSTHAENLDPEYLGALSRILGQSK